MEGRIVYEATKENLMEAIKEVMTEEVEQRIFNRFESRIIDSRTACKILDISDRTLYTYIKLGFIEIEDKVRGGDNKFRLSHILKVNVPEIRKQIRYGNIER